MRLLFVSHSFPPTGRPQANLGGMQRVAMDLFAALREIPDLLVFDRILRSSSRWTGLRTAGFLLSSLWQIPRLVRSRQVDTILFSSMVTASLAVPLRRRLAALGCQTVAICHGLDVVLSSGLYQWWVRRVLKALDVVTPVSHATAAACIERGTDPERIHVVPNGISADRFRPPVDDRHTSVPSSYADETGPSDRGLILLSVGRHVKRKGFDWFVDQVMPRLPESVSYWIVGEGPATSDIRSAVRRNQLEHRVHLPGRVDGAKLEQLYARADLFVMPNVPLSGDMEGFGVVLLEAGLMGLPCLASDLEGMRDVVADGVSGHLLPALNPDRWASAIRTLQTDHHMLERLSAGARPYVLEHFGWNGVASRFVELFRNRALRKPETN
jgi:phosphatidyl-myo-inositol dimannoside synthase